MAQSKLDVDFVGERAKNKASEKNTVPDLLLQQHNSLLVRSLVNRISMRTMFLLEIGVLVVANPISLSGLLTAISVACLIAGIGYSERQFIISRLRGLEEMLAKHSGDDWEDVYIQSRFYTMQHKPLAVEPFLWAAIAILVGIFRMLFEKKLGL